MFLQLVGTFLAFLTTETFICEQLYDPCLWENIYIFLNGTLAPCLRKKLLLIVE